MCPFTRYASGGIKSDSMLMTVSLQHVCNLACRFPRIAKKFERVDPSLVASALIVQYEYREAIDLGEADKAKLDDLFALGLSFSQGDLLCSFLRLSIEPFSLLFWSQKRNSALLPRQNQG